MKKKILHIVPTLGSGGAERQLVDVVCNTSSENFSHTVCIIGQDDFFSPAIKQKGYKVINLNLSGKRPWLQAAKRIVPIIHEQKPDIIHSWLYDAHITARLSLLAGRRRIPLLSSLQNSDYEQETIAAGNWSPKKVGILRLIDKFSAGVSKPHFVACSNFVANSYIKKLGIARSQMSVIYNSVDPQTLVCESDDSQKIRRSLKIPADGFVYLNIGRLDPQKGQTYLLLAFHKVLREVPQAYLVIIGTGSLETSLKELAKSLKIEDRVFFLGVRSDIGACLEMADAFVFPSLFEGLGIVLVEAMSKRLACIASRLDVLEEVIEDKVSGLLVAPKSETELAEAMIQVFECDDLRDKLGREAFCNAEKQFFSEVLMPEWEVLYTKVSAKF
ncbi:MAG: glycosyltransferase [Pyrinomonadaceae bacterium]|nr:glycosyltransferase [Pyrinomonadaceae bacterium]